MIQDAFLFHHLITIITFVLGYIAFKLYIWPYYQVLYYKQQGLPIFFNWRLIPIFEWWNDVKKNESFFYRYKQLLKVQPNTKAIAENFLSQAIVQVIDPEMIKEFLKKYDIYHKDFSFIELVNDLASGSVVQIEGAEWKRRRRVLSGAFNFDFLKDTVPMIVETTQRQFTQWAQSGDLTHQNLVEKLCLITGDVTGTFMFGKRFQGQEINGVPMTVGMQRLLVNIMDEVISPAHILFGVKAIRANILERHKKLNSDIANMRMACKKMIDEEAKVNERTEKNIISLLLEMRESKKAEDRMTDEGMISEFVGFFAGGTDTTSHLVASAIYFLFKHPHVLEKVRKEVDREFADPSSVNIDNVNRMDYTTAVLKETFRIGGPTTGLLDRIATQDDELCGLKIKKGTRVNLIMDLLYTSEKYFSKPKEFIPERWLDGPEFANEGYRKEAYAFIPFSAGPKSCIGQHLAMIEARTVLALFVKTFDFSFPEDYKFVLALRLAYEPVDPLMVTMKPKNCGKI